MAVTDKIFKTLYSVYFLIMPLQMIQNSLRLQRPGMLDIFSHQPYDPRARYSATHPGDLWIRNFVVELAPHDPAAQIAVPDPF